ncbi:MAG TPA: MoaD/ThiS family protein [Armatimonadota bacterium]|nr:MoaD/ThiS family protein [Armatimonadota bacterium]
MRVHVYFFASHRDVVGTDQIDLDLSDGCNVAGVQSLLAERYPRLAPLLGCSRASVNEQYCGSDRLLADGDRIAFIPPVSGG